MNKKLMAAAVASAFAAPAFAQTANNVVLYGRLNVGIDNASAVGSYMNTATVNHDFKDRTRVWDTGSRLGVRGTEDLGNGLRAIFQIESGLNANNGQPNSEANQYNTSAGTLGSRPTWVGLEGNWGRVQFGRQDVYWGNGTINQTGANYVNNDIPWLTGGSGRVSAGVARQSNVVSYTTPTVAGFNASVYYSSDSNVSGGLTGSSAQYAPAGKNTNSRLEAATARWAAGPFQAQYDFAYKQAASDFAGTATLNLWPKTWAHKLGFAWMYVPGGQISVIGTYVTNEDAAVTEVVPAAGVSPIFQTLKDESLTLTWEHLVGGNILLLGQVGHQFNVRGCDGTPVSVNGIPSTVNDQVCHNSASTAFMEGVRYNLSKRTGIYVTYNHMNNGQNQFADYNGAAYSVGSTLSTVGGVTVPGSTSFPGASGIPSTSKGADISIFALGIQHNF